jgi:transcriptional regulator with XRE-family HTH domain
MRTETPASPPASTPSATSGQFLRAPRLPGPEAGFGALLRDWRNRRGISQLETALRSGVSQRHVSFLETGRAKPSREMVVQLAAALDIPLRQQNALLLAAGFAPIYRESDLGAPELVQVRQALDHMLAQQEPYPAVVIDRLWNLLQANRAAQLFTAALLPAAFTPPADKPLNLLKLVLDPKGLKPAVVNWEEAARYLVQATYSEVLSDGGDAEAVAFLDEIMAYPDVAPLMRRAPTIGRPLPVLSVEYKVASGQSVKVFTTIATLGTPQDVTLQEVRIENFFPTDAASEKYFRDLAA